MQDVVKIDKTDILDLMEAVGDCFKGYTGTDRAIRLSMKDFGEQVELTAEWEN